MRDGAKVKLGRLYEKTSQAGRRYFVGHLGAARILLFDSGEKDDDGGASWDLYATEAEDTQTRGNAPRRTNARGQDSVGRQGTPQPLPYAGRTSWARGNRSEPGDDGRPFHDDPLGDFYPAR